MTETWWQTIGARKGYDDSGKESTWMSRAIPHICHGPHGRRPCKFFLPGVNFYRFNAKNWHFWLILREKVAFFTDLTRKIGVFRCKFYFPKIMPVYKKMTNIRYDRFHKRITHNQTYIVVLETISSYIVEYFFFSIKHKECLFLRTLLKLCLGEPDRWLSTVASLTENILYTSHLVVPSVNIYWRGCFEQPQCRRLFISSKLRKGRHADRTITPP